METDKRLDLEWVTLNAVRDLITLAVQGNSSKSTYKNALALGAAICPEILGADVSVLRQDRESDLTKEYRQRAVHSSTRDKKEITALSLVQKDIDEFESLVKVVKAGDDKTEADKLKKKLRNLCASEKEINPDKQVLPLPLWIINIKVPTQQAAQAKIVKVAKTVS